jgi:AraC-like DNA-binding protein
MDLQIILHNTECGKTEFQLSRDVRPWGLLMLTSSGRYTVSFPEFGQTHTILPHEISYIPPNTPFIRRVIEPIDFHQFTFRIDPCHPFAQALHAGKLEIPTAQVIALEKSLSLSALSPIYSELIRYDLEHILKENYLFATRSATDPLSEDIRLAVTYMDEHLDEKIDMAELAALVFLSHTGLIWKFHRELGCTPQQYLISLRIRLAKQLLLESDLPIAQIAQRCGYANAYYFSNAFRTCTGISPSAFRRQTYSQKNT